MEAEEANLEEGEIQSGNDSDSHIYVPLKRPSNYAADVPLKRFPVNQQYSDSEDEVLSSDSDSDSDTNILSTKKPKRKKLLLKPKPLKKPEKLKKYDIWSARAQEDVLSETLTTCDVTLKDRSRSVESYDFSLARKYYEELEEQEGKLQGSKRTREARKNNHFKPRRRSRSNDKDLKGKPRVISDLSVDIKECGNAEIARDMANKLCEEREDLILKVLDTMGKERTLGFFTETRRIEEEGGMLIMNGIRRRTPGGVFLFLVRNDDHITLDQKNKIFDEEKQKYKQIQKQQRKEKKIAFRQKQGLKGPPPKPNLPELLTRADLIGNNRKKSNNRESEGETDAQNCTNPPPTPESDHHEVWDGMESPPTPQPHVTIDNTMEETRGKLKSYDDDFLDIGGAVDMELF